ncbi:UNVERIFIED_CONTAM: hypothetical protein K2H54_048452 [Gekko kuhli]
MCFRWVMGKKVKMNAGLKGWGGQNKKKADSHTSGIYSYQIFLRNIMISCSFLIGGLIQRGFRNCSCSKANSNGKYSSQYSTFKTCSYTVYCAKSNAPPIEGAVYLQ